MILKENLNFQRNSNPAPRSAAASAASHSAASESFERSCECSPSDYKQCGPTAPLFKGCVSIAVQ